MCEVRFWDGFGHEADFLKIFVCEVRFCDAVLVDVVPMGGSQIFVFNLCVREVRFWDGFGLYFMRFWLLEQILANVSRIWAYAERLTRMLRTNPPKV